MTFIVDYTMPSYSMVGERTPLSGKGSILLISYIGKLIYMKFQNPTGRSAHLPWKRQKYLVFLPLNGVIDSQIIT